ncbi:MAG: ABC transporter substrate-binding protein [Rhodobiaceae bacterium]|nr:ABC transporter substrate-binding protein [Rhodobiaceae bacterium]MCC0055127.1 ABC transporter substrate-binding protein [Rhodobiaceae bacterium]
MQKGPNRRVVLAGAAASLAFLRGLPAVAEETPRLHGLSAFGDLKYGADFTHFAYVNPDAPKGGNLARTTSVWAFNQNPNTFNTLNTLILKGDAPVMLNMIYDTLMVRALDEPDAVYGLIAEWVEKHDGGNRIRFGLRPEARFHDGSALTAEDVAFTLETLKKDGHPHISQSLIEMESASAVEPHVLEVVFTGRQARDLPQFVASLPIISKAFYASREFTDATMERPLGCGPYKVGDFRQGTYISYERVDDYWGRDLPVNRGRHNFDSIRYEFYRDRDVAFEAFKAGRYTFREEFTSRVWATGYDFPAIADGRVVRATLPDQTPSGAQGWFINTRREKFADPRVREALINGFDFEWTNKSLFYGAYSRTKSYFQNSEMMAEGPPSPAELALLEPFRGKVPDEVFGEPYSPPVSDGSGRDRSLFAKATKLLEEAGVGLKDGHRVMPDGTPFEVEFLDDDGSLERIAQPYMRNLERLGIATRFRQVDAAQYQDRLNSFDFDLVVQRYSMPPIPGEEIKRYWVSAEAGIAGTRNLSGIRSPAIDALTETMIAARTREEQIIAAKALDRILRAGRYWVPQWNRGTHLVAYWDQFGFPPEKPRYALEVDSTWWFDKDKARRIGKEG